MCACRLSFLWQVTRGKMSSGVGVQLAGFSSALLASHTRHVWAHQDLEFRTIPLPTAVSVYGGGFRAVENKIHVISPVAFAPPPYSRCEAFVSRATPSIADRSPCSTPPMPYSVLSLRLWHAAPCHVRMGVPIFRIVCLRGTQSLHVQICKQASDDAMLRHENHSRRRRSK